jgi:hypothetical protein
MPPLATAADYELLVGPVAQEDRARLDVLLAVGSSVVVTVAPGLFGYLVWATDPDTG